MSLQLRGGTGSSDFQVAASAVNAYRKFQSDDGPRFSRPKTRRQMKSKIIRGKLGASLRGAIDGTKLLRD
jgi:hypothetical protein